MGSLSDIGDEDMKKILCVGLNHFLRPGNDLQGCVPDARSMSALLGGGDMLLDAGTTKKNVMRWLSLALDDAKDGKVDSIALTWSGHGTHYDRPEEADGLGEALVCYDIAEKDGDWDPDTIIKDSELHDLLNQFPASCLVEVWLDTCYSGGMDRVLFPSRSSRFLHNPGNTEGVQRFANSTVTAGLNSNIVMWTASSEAQTSADAYIKSGFHGAFTWYWLQAYQAMPQSSRLELLLATRKGLADNHFEQLPRLKAWNARVQAGVGQ